MGVGTGVGVGVTAASKALSTRASTVACKFRDGVAVVGVGVVNSALNASMVA